MRELNSFEDYQKTFGRPVVRQEILVGRRKTVVFLRELSSRERMDMGRTLFPPKKEGEALDSEAVGKMNADTWNAAHIAATACNAQGQRLHEGFHTPGFKVQWDWWLDEPSRNDLVRVSNLVNEMNQNTPTQEDEAVKNSETDQATASS